MMTEEMFIVFKNRTNEISKNWWRKNRTQTIEILEKVSRLLVETLLIVQSRVTRQIRHTNRDKSRNNKTIWSRRNLLLRRRVAKLERRLKMHKSGSVKARIRAKLNKAKMRLLRGMSESRAIHRTELWERVKLNEKRRLSDIVRDTGEHCRIDTESQINSIAREKFPKTTRTWEKRIESEIVNTNAEGLQVSQREAEQAIKELKDKKYTSPEGIKMRIFYEAATKFIKEEVCKIAQMSFKTVHVPKVCWSTKGTIIPKKAPGQYRIVHVSNPLAALLEIVALHRLEHRLEQQALISPYQYGFTALRGRHDLVARVIELAASNKSLDDELDKANKAATIVALDIEGAFDNIDQDALIDKMNKELGPDSLKHWIAQFVLNRRISVQYRQLRSKERWVQRGVPQGSALGPILFNFATHNIENGITRPTQCEILKYADDLIIFNKGTTKAILQDTIDKLTNKLADIKLRIKPEKCSIMHIRYRGNARSTPGQQYTINGQPIKEVDKMNILGVHITRTLALDKETTIQKVKMAASRLYNIKLMEIVHCAKEWQILINNILYCHLITNNWQILAIDRNGRKWTDAIMIKTLRAIFDWPGNTSSKIIRLVTKARPTYQQIKKTILLGKATEHYNSYTAIEMLLQRSELVNSNEIIHTPMPLERHLSRHRRHYDPTKTLPYRLDNIALDKTELTNKGPIWLLISKKRASAAVEVLGDTVLQVIAARHATYRTSYFNTVALLWRITNDTSIMNRRIVLDEKDATVQALTNNRNKDWRIIALREAIIERGWHILTYAPGDTYDTKQSLTGIYNNLNLIQKHHHHSFESWLMLMQQAVAGTHHDQCDQNDPRKLDRAETGGGARNGTPKTTTAHIENLKEPNVDDYIMRHKVGSLNKIEENNEHIRNLTTICKLIGGNQVEIWHNIPPNWLNGPKLLMMGDMVREARTGQLVHIDENYRTTHCEICNKSAEDEHPTLHRATNCAGYASNREQILRIIKMYPNMGIDKALMNKMHCQTILRLLAECALKPPAGN